MELAKVIQNVDENTFNEYSGSFAYFSRDYPQLSEKWIEFTKEQRFSTTDRQSRWHQTLREIRFFEDQELDYMYQRVMSLSRQIIGNNAYFTVKTYSGKGSIPDRVTLLNRLIEMSDELLSEIYPSILRLVNYKIDDIEIHSQAIRGTVNWNRTIQHALKVSGGIPTTFVCTIPKKSLSTHENVLLYLAINWLQKDAIHLLNFQKIDYINTADKKKIWRIVNSSQRVLDSPLFNEIKNELQILNSFSKTTKKIKPILDLVERKIKKSQYQQNVYLNLINWIRNYIDFNVNRYQNLTNFTFENVKDFDTMFELWILFEYITFLKKEYHVSCFPLIQNSKLDGFRIENNGNEFFIYYEKPYQVPIGKQPGLNNPKNYRKPDFTIEYGNQCICGHSRSKHQESDGIGEKCDEIIKNNEICSCDEFCMPAPIVLDAKNWRNQGRLEAVQKMGWYLMLMNKYKSKTAILFFSNYEEGQDQDNPITNQWGPIPINQGEWEFVNFVIKASRKSNFKEQLNIIFSNISSRIPQIKKIENMT
ncbi:MAG: hypothetical protein J4F36_14400 [Nitrosopumilaceae archaeon]|nr:hypothetical protein [Nitrosopumilaceae archaeon]